MANSTASASTVSPPPVSRLTPPSARFSMSRMKVSVISSMPFLRISSVRKERTSSSNPPSTLAPRINIVTLEPSPWKTPASSTPMYPAPTTASRRGSSGKDSASSEVMACSMPVMSGGR